ncbi:phage tail protein [Sphingobium sp. AS12]|uniref:phage tail protein n=1 Tax=Sphingobium sp. AS12 TaxID=2849495 RepID=UPI001C31DF83|nr:phage tail protein [Sphingobium sp. AS12]MBV2149279.1 phage tail protein [Sphingobium sp. AS12]
MSDIILTITNAGRAALINAEGNGTAPVRISHCGVSSTAVAPTVTATALPGEIKKIATIAGEYVGDDTIHLVIRDETTAVYALRSFGLYLSDGTLFALYGQASPIMEKSAQAILLLALDASFMDVNASSITFGATNFTNPPATTERQGVVELATRAEAIAGIDNFRVPATRELKEAVFAWLDSRFGVNNAAIWHKDNDGAGSGLDADLLDGQQGSYYADVRARLGFTPVNKAGDTMSGPLEISYLGSASLSLNSGGVGVGRLAMQSDGNLVLYRDDGAGQKPIFSIPSQTDPFNVQRVMTRQGFLVWDAGNDGAGSGLDADLLDGQHGSYYTNIVARLGYTPLNMTAYTAADVRAKLLTVDGSGSGVDADLLDGQDGSYYADIRGRLGFTPVNKAGDTMSGSLEISHVGSPYLALNSGGVAVGRLAMQSDGNLVLYRDDGSGQRPIFSIPSQTDPFNVQRVMTRQGHLVWDAGNDGSGSGLDADLLDGQDGSYYSNVVARLGYTPLDNAAYTAADVRAKLLTVDGSGSGLDADLLDGQDGGYYSNIVARLGYTPLNVTAYTAADVRTKLLTVDGSGSGLDADLLDGQDGSYYSNIIARLGFTPVNKTGDTMSGSLEIAQVGSPSLSLNSGGVGVGRLAMQSDGNLVLYRDDGSGQQPIFSIPSQTDPFNVQRIMTRQGHLVWDAGNDGSGSGLDADLLDGQQGSYYADITARLGYTPLNITAYSAADVRAKLLTVDGSGSGIDADLLDGQEASAFARLLDFGALLTGNGYQKLPGGLILQWGNVVAPSGGVNNVTFPIAFPTECMAAYASNQSGAVPSAWAATGNLTRISMTVGHASSSLNPSSAGTAAFWFALGR